MLSIFLHDWEGNVLGELQGLRSRRLSVGLNRTASLSFDMPLLDNPLTEDLFTAANASLSAYQPSDFRLVSVYRLNPYTDTRELLFIGPIIIARDGADGGEEATASFTAVSAYWRMGTRIADNANDHGRREQGLSVSGQRGQIAAQLIRDTNTGDGNSWLRAPDTAIATTDEVEINNWGGFRTVAQCISDLSGEGSVSGFDWVVAPKLDSDSQGLILGEWTCAPLIGQDLTSSIIFEYGIGRNNLRSAFRSRSLENYANIIDHVSSGLTPYVIQATRPISIIQSGAFEAVADGDLIDYSLRESWVELNRDLRGRPRRLFEVSPERSDLEETAGSIPIPLIDYAEGDRVRARIYYADRLRWDVALRIYQIQINWSDQGEETADLGLYLE
jgi:hypothetical protein